MNSRKSPQSLYFRVRRSPASPLFFPNPACTGLELRDTTPAAFASNEYGFGKCVLLYYNQI
jgi:hypothetical protein